MKVKTIMRTEFFSELTGRITATKTEGGYILERDGYHMTSSRIMRKEYKEATAKTRRGECEPKLFSRLNTVADLLIDNGVEHFGVRL